MLGLSNTCLVFLFGYLVKKNCTVSKKRNRMKSYYNTYTTPPGTNTFTYFVATAYTH